MIEWKRFSDRTRKCKPLIEMTGAVDLERTTRSFSFLLSDLYGSVPFPLATSEMRNSPWKLDCFQADALDVVPHLNGPI